MDKGFRKIAITLMGLTALSVILVGVYLWYNFNSRSNLVLVVPDKSQWYIHVQTKEWLKEFQNDKKPVSLMEFEATMKSYPIFRGITSPKEVGISPHSDWVFFGKHGASFVAVSVFSESALDQFCRRLVDSGWLQPPVKSELCTRYKVAGKHAYIAFKHKAVVLGLLPDSTENAVTVQKVFNDIFSGRISSFMENAELQSLYDKGSAIIAWKSNKFQPAANHGGCNYFVYPFNQPISAGFKQKQLHVYTASAGNPPQFWDILPHTDTTNRPKSWVAIPPITPSEVALTTLLQSLQITINRFSKLGIEKN